MVVAYDSRKLWQSEVRNFIIWNQTKSNRTADHPTVSDSEEERKVDNFNRCMFVVKKVCTV